MITFKAANRKVRKQLKRTREKHFIRLAKRIQAAHDAKDYRLYYKLANLVSLPERKEITRGPQILDQKQVRKLDKTLTRNVEETQVRWKEHWMGLFNQPGEVGPGIEALLPTQLPTNLDILDTPFTSAELSAGLRKMANDKAPGPDGYSIEVEKYLNSPELRNALLALFNKALEAGEVPAQWKNVIITAVYKRKGAMDDCNNYRGISLLSHNSKLLERMLLHRLEISLDEYIPINQYGFKKNCGTVDAILISKLLGTSAYNQRMADIRCYVDLTKAYDKVNRELLWKILRRLGIPEKIVRLLISFHEGALPRPTWKESYQALFPLTEGSNKGQYSLPSCSIFSSAL